MSNSLKLKTGLLLLLSFAMGCKREQTVDVENLAGSSTTNPHDILSISKSEFNALQQEYAVTKKVYDGKFGSIKSFTAAVGSLQEKEYSSPQEVTYEEALDEVLSDPFLGSVINPDGEIIVDNDLYRITLFGTFKTSPDNRERLDRLIASIEKEYPLEDIDLDDIDFSLSAFRADGEQNKFLNEGEILLVDDIVYIPTFSNDDVSIQDDLVTGDPGLVAPVGWSDDSVSPALPPYLPTSEEEALVQPFVKTKGFSGPFITENNWESHFPSVSTNLDHPMFHASNMITGNMVNPDGSFWRTIFKKQAIVNNFDRKYRTSVNFYNRNYGFWKSIGLQVKHQKKGWLFWRKHKTNVIAAGWEGIMYSTPMPRTFNWHYSTFINGRTLYGGQGSFNKNYMFKLPEQVNLWKIPTPQGDYFAPLIVSNGLPVPENVRMGGTNKIIQYLWGLIMKKVKDGETIVKENNKPVYYNALQNIGKKAIIFQEPGSPEYYLFFPPHFQMAYNTSVIDIPLDKYNADIGTGLQLVAGTVVNPSNNFGSLKNWASEELKRKFVMKQAVVYGSSQRDGVWRGVRVVHN